MARRRLRSITVRPTRLHHPPRLPQRLKARPASTRSITPLSYRIIPETCLPFHKHGRGSYENVPKRARPSRQKAERARSCFIRCTPPGSIHWGYRLFQKDKPHQAPCRTFLCSELPTSIRLDNLSPRCQLPDI